MTIVVMLVLGAIVGWLVSKATRARPSQVSWIVLAGMTGSLLGGWLLYPMVGGLQITSADVTAVAITVGLLGALVLLAFMLFFRRNSE